MELKSTIILTFLLFIEWLNSRHERLKPDGKLEGLEYLWEFGYQVYENDPERTEREKQERIKENDKVIEILKRKGFY